MKQQRSQRKAAEEKKQQTINTIIGSIVAVIVLALVLYNQGLFQNDTAFSINGKNYTAAQVQMYYSEALYSAAMGQYTPEEGGEAYDLTLYSDVQMYSASQTWHDFLTQEACNILATAHTIAETAKSQNYRLPDEALAQLDSTIATLDTAWIGRATSKNAYFRNIGISEADYIAMEEMDLYSNYYQYHLYESYEHSQEEYDTFYEENQDMLDVITFSQIQYAHETEVLLDEDGNEIEQSEENIAISDGFKTMMMVQAQNALEALEADTPWDEVIEEFASLSSASAESQTQLSAGFSGTDEASLWILDQDRQPGDMTMVEDVFDEITYFSVLVFEGRERAEDNLANIRNILVAATPDDQTLLPTDEDWDSSYLTAQEIVDDWQSQGGDEDSFAALAETNSMDSSNATLGGLSQSISPYDYYDQDLIDWVFDSSREEGDYTIVKDSTGTVDGWQILYFKEFGREIWEENGFYSLCNDKIEAWLETISTEISSKLSYGPALSDVAAASLFG